MQNPYQRGRDRRPSAGEKAEEPKLDGRKARWVLGVLFVLAWPLDFFLPQNRSATLALTASTGVIVVLVCLLRIFGLWKPSFTAQVALGVVSGLSEIASMTYKAYPVYTQPGPGTDLLHFIALVVPSDLLNATTSICGLLALVPAYRARSWLPFFVFWIVEVSIRSPVESVQYNTLAPGAPTPLQHFLRFFSLGFFSVETVPYLVAAIGGLVVVLAINLKRRRYEAELISSAEGPDDRDANHPSPMPSSRTSP